MAATTTVKTAVTSSWSSYAHLPHVILAPHTFYYGTCGSTSYAAAQFTPGPGATEQEQVNGQDDGGTIKYFSETDSTAWKYVASDVIPQPANGCAAIPQIPASLAAAWSNCKSH